MSHLSAADYLAAGLRSLPDCREPFAAAQAAWRFYSNPSITPPKLAEPLIDAARAGVQQSCANWALVVLDWSLLHYGGHESKTDRIPLAHNNDFGYELLTALAVSDRDGRPLAPVCLELRAADGVRSSRSEKVLPAPSQLDGLSPVMAHVSRLELGRPMVFIADREADSVEHYRQWSAAGHHFVIRANNARRVLHAGCEKKLEYVSGDVPLTRCRNVEVKGASCTQYIGETNVTLHRPARTHRVINGVKRHKNIAGESIELRLIISEIRNERGATVARWLLLSNLLKTISAQTIALWYYWRWSIEAYHKLLKSAGQHVERWLQDDARQLLQRLLICAMSCVIVWQLSRSQAPQAGAVRNVLVRLSGRLMKRGKGAQGFTEPALLAGLGILLPTLALLEQYSAEELKKLIHQALPAFLIPSATDTG
jgi:hypothetical protein